MKEINTYDDNLEGGNLPDFRAENPFTVPPAYFETAAAHIVSICKLTQLTGETLQTDSTLPATYFEDLTTQIKSRISLDDILSSSKTTDFEVPADYFADAQDEILSAVKLDNLLTTGREDGYTVEQSYFDSLSTRITQRIASESNVIKESPVKVISIQRWMKYAAAACLLFVLSIGGYYSLNSDMAISPTASTVATATITPASLSNISDDEIMDYLAFNNDCDELDHYVDFIDVHDHDHDEVKCSKLEDKDLEAYINHML